jgi:glycosyltransferase involved in cell wall biosynthesis
VLHGKRIIVVMPAYNAAVTLEQTFRDLPHDIVDEVILVDDCSHDETAEIAKKLGITTFIHENNRGYGGNQKTCYKAALEHGADVVIMVHPDYQYDPRLALAISSMIVDGPYDMVIASRILGGHALKGGMPLWKYIANRALSWAQNFALGAKISEYHTGYRAFSRKVLESIPIEKNSNDFIFDNQIMVQIFMKGFLIGELTCPTKYFPEASSINFRRSVRYGFGVLKVSLQGLVYRLGIMTPEIFK